MPLRQRAPMIGVGTVAVIVIALAIVLLGNAGSSGERSCTSYPTPGAAAGSGTKVPTELAAKYSVFSAPQRSVDRLTSAQTRSLKASGLIMSGTRFLGESDSARIYVVPAEHLLSLPLAPARCLTAVQRVTEQDSLPILRSEYKQAALCILVLEGGGQTQECGPAAGTPYPLLSSSTTPGFGLVPNGVHHVTVSYWAAPPRTVAVHRNSFVINVPAQRAPPCGVQWIDDTGAVQKTPAGCSYLATEIPALSRYRSYVAGKLSTLRTQISSLASATKSGDTAKARSGWLTAHLTWLQIGQDDGAYGAFGALGGQIDGLAAGHAKGTADPAFTGFHRVEFDLWTKHDLHAAARDTVTLQTLLTRLAKAPLTSYLPADTNGIGSWLLRPHEVLEDALRDSLSGNDDYGSGTDLATITADVAAVRELLKDLAPTFNRIAPHLGTTAGSELSALLEAIDQADPKHAGRPIRSLPTRRRQQIDADVGAALETLAPLPDLITSTGSNAPS